MIGEGAIPLVALTAPSSILAFAITSSVSSGPFNAYLQPFISTLGTFVILVVVCGGLNAVLVFIAGSAIERGRRR